MARTDKRVTAVIIRDWKILLIHRFKNGRDYWVFPGGGVEEGEDLDTALKREVVEETGLELHSYAHLFDQLADNGETCIFYRCELQPGEPTLGGPELEEQTPNNQHLLEWVELRRLSGLTLFPKQNLLVDILDGREKWWKYKGYSGIVEYDNEERIFTGEVIGQRPMITFQGRTPEEIEESFRRSIDLYLDMCAEDGVAPDKP